MSAQDTKNLLVELVCEELPPKALKKLGEAFAENIVRSLLLQGLVSLEPKYSQLANPRRLGAPLHRRSPGRSRSPPPDSAGNRAAR